MAGKGSNRGGSDERKTTPKKWDQPHKSDARKGEEAGKYPNYWSHKTRSGHTFSMDDSKGHETITLQHRSGTAIQMDPDGGLHITAHNSKYEITFGEHRMTISGAQDITVKGDASMRVYGNLNTTVHKDYNLTVNGDFNITAKNFNRHIRGNMDTMAKNETKKFEGSSGVTAHGGIARVAKGSVTVASHADQAHFAGAKGLNMAVAQDGNMTMVTHGEGHMYMETKNGKLDGTFSQGGGGAGGAGGGDGKKVTMMAKDGKFQLKSDEETNVESKNNEITMKAEKNVNVKSTSGGIKNEAKQDITHESEQNVRVKATSDVQVEAQKDIKNQAGSNFNVQAASSSQISAGQNAVMKAGSTASVSGGSEASVHAPTVHVQGSGITNIDGGMLNLNGGLGSIFSNFLGFDPTKIMEFNPMQTEEAEGAPDPQATRADQPQQEPDHESFWESIH